MTPDLDTMTGEELNRKYHELAGWWFETTGPAAGFWHKPTCPGLRGIGNPLSCTGHIPNLHLDANLLIAELDNTFLYECSITRENTKIVECFGLQSAGPYDFRGLGTTVCDAGLRALIEFWQRPNKGVTITDAQAPTSGTRS